MRTEEKHELQQLIREVIAQTAPAVVEQTLQNFGFTVNDVNSVQQDMAHLRKLRKGSEIVKSVTIKTCVGALVSGIIFMLCAGLRAWLANPKGP